MNNKIDLNNISISYFSGDWCPMCVRATPIIMKYLNSIGLESGKLFNYEIKRGKLEPKDIIKKYKIIFVPTLIIFNSGKEIGRIIESPIKSWEEDILEIIKFK
jgi:thiol-disulfide isomerase/thioredoxin